METAEDQLTPLQAKEPVAFLHEEKPRATRIRRKANGNGK
jgi:hypothetical protein